LTDRLSHNNYLLSSLKRNNLQHYNPDIVNKKFKHIKFFTIESICIFKDFIGHKLAPQIVENKENYGAKFVVWLQDMKYLNNS